MKKKTSFLKFEACFILLTNKSVVHSVDLKRERDSEKSWNVVCRRSSARKVQALRSNGLNI